MAKVVANQKGGVAKTTTFQALGVALAEAGWRVLAVDLDPQSCLTYSFGFDPDGRTRHARQVLDEVGTRYGLTVFDPPVPKSVRFAEAPSEGCSILQHAPGSPGAEAYRSLVGRVGDLLAAS